MMITMMMMIVMMMVMMMKMMTLFSHTPLASQAPSYNTDYNTDD